MIFNPEAKLSEGNGLYFFIIYKPLSLGKLIPIYKSEIKKPAVAGSNTVRWSSVQIGTLDLFKDDMSEIKLEFFRSNPSGKHAVVGTCSLTLGALKSNTT